MYGTIIIECRVASTPAVPRFEIREIDRPCESTAARVAMVPCMLAWSVHSGELVSEHRAVTRVTASQPTAAGLARFWVFGTFGVAASLTAVCVANNGRRKTVRGKHSYAVGGHHIAVLPL